MSNLTTSDNPKSSTGQTELSPEDAWVAKFCDIEILAHPVAVKTDKDDGPAKKPQEAEWPVLEIQYGTALSALPRVRLVNGNLAAEPAYTPKLDGTLPAVGSHTLTVAVPGDETWHEWQAKVTLKVYKARLAVRVEPASMASGNDVPPLKHSATGLVPGDDIAVTFKHDVTKESPDKLDGYPVTPVVAFAKGSADNYLIDAREGRLVVTKSYGDLDGEITRIRHGTLALPKEKRQALFDRLDEIEKLRDRRAEDVAALAKMLGVVETELYDASYIPVNEVVVTALDGTTLALDQTLRFAAKVEPDNLQTQATVRDVVWSVSHPNLATITKDGVLSRIGRDGGSVTVRATSTSREPLFGAILVEVVPKPQAIVIAEAPPVFLGKTLQLTASVEPAEADQSLKWSLVPKFPKNVTLSGDVLRVDKPDQRGGSWEGQATVRAISTVDNSIRAEATIEFGGIAVSDITLKTDVDRRTIGRGDTVVVTASVWPNEAAQDVTWSVDDTSVARIDASDAKSVTVTLIAGGAVSVIATSTDGTGFARQTKLVAKVFATGLTLAAPKTTLDIGETTDLTVGFLPTDAQCRIAWTTSKEGIVKVDQKGHVEPLGSGTVDVTVAIPDTSISETVKLTVTAEDGSAVTGVQWKNIEPLIDRYAGLIGILGNKPAKAAYGTWKTELARKAKEDSAPTLGEVKDELIDLRDDNYTLLHQDWLAKAGFAAKTNCYIRNDETIDISGQQFSIHITMFPNGLPMTLGDKFQDLEDQVYASRASGFVSTHATMYVLSGRTDHQIKSYAAGDDWRPPYVNRLTWEADDPPKLKYEDMYAEVETWLWEKMGLASTALEAEFDKIKLHDSEKIG